LGTCVGGGHSPVLPDVIAPRYAKPGWSGNRSDWLVSNGGRLGRHPHPTHRRMRFFRLLLLISFCASARALSAQSAPDLIRGHVTDDSSNVVAGAAVFVTRGPDRAVKQTVTDSSGRYSLTFENGTGDWLVAVNGAGYKTARRRVQRVDAETAFTADFVLSRDAATLAAIARWRYLGARGDDAGHHGGRQRTLDARRVERVEPHDTQRHVDGRRFTAACGTHGDSRHWCDVRSDARRLLRRQHRRATGRR
jgi:uncharacterized protein YfiM (DUF2279 family)